MIQRLSILCLISLASACGGKTATPATPAPVASVTPATVAYKSAFDKGTTEKWTPIYGNWWVKDGAYLQDDARLEGTKTMLNLPDSDCYTFQFKARPLSDTTDGFMAIVKYQKKYVWWKINLEARLSGIEDVNETIQQVGLIKADAWQTVKVVVNKERIVGWLNDAQKWSVRRTPEEVKGLQGKDGKDLVGLAGLGTWKAQYQFADVSVTPTCQ